MQERVSFHGNHKMCLYTPDVILPSAWYKYDNILYLNFYYYIYILYYSISFTLPKETMAKFVLCIVRTFKVNC